MTPLPLFDDASILSLRGTRNEVDPTRPYAHLIEQEPARAGGVVDVATVFITNRECPYRCLMCDLWKNTTEHPVPVGTVCDQVAWALAQHPDAPVIKLYNAGSFFDRKAIAPADVDGIVALVRDREEVILECHPRMVGESCVEFARAIAPTRLQMAMGLETVDPFVLSRLNKRMTLDDFRRATDLLVQNDIGVRAFILLCPPGHDAREGLAWTCRSIDFAFEVGVECCAVIPTRAGNGIMEQLEREGLFAPPPLWALEEAMEYGLKGGSGRVLVDLWDIEKFFDCRRCGPSRAERLARMNLEQTITPPIACSCGAKRHEAV